MRSGWAMWYVSLLAQPRLHPRPQLDTNSTMPATQLPDGLTANVTSAGPDEGITCFLYSEANCSGTRSAPIVNPGYADLSTIDFAKKAASWRC